MLPVFKEYRVGNVFDERTKQRLFLIVSRVQRFKFFDLCRQTFFGFLQL